MESHQEEDNPQNVLVPPNNELLQYMQINADFINGLSQEYIILREILNTVFAYG